VTGKTATIIGAACALAGFVGGFLPQYQQRQVVSAELASARQQLEVAKGQLEGATASVRLAGLLGHALSLRDLIAGQNYGLAQQQATRFFDAVAEEAGRTPAGSMAANALAAVLETRDRVTAALSTADPGVALIVRESEARLRGALGYTVPEMAPPPPAPGSSAVPVPPVTP
jgi:hypothetical protein